MGQEVCMVTGQGSGKAAYLDQLAPRVIHKQIPAEATGHAIVLWLSDHIDSDRPLLLMAAKDGDEPILKSFQRHMLARTPHVAIDLYAMLGTPLLVREQQEYPLSWRWRRLVRRSGLRKHYASFAGVMAICEGVRDDFLQYSGLAPSRVHLVHNPVIDESLLVEATHAVSHPWLLEKSLVPVIMAIGRMSKVKDFSCLLAAFGYLLKRRKARLIIIGEGRQRKRLQQQIERSGLSEAVDMPGFLPSPYAYLAKASLLVVSSRREGGPNVLIEAMALGIPVVSTDCPYGPRQILDQGRLGKLVPVGDALKLAEAMEQTLDRPLDAGELKLGAKPYERDAASRTWAKAMGLSL